MLVAELELLHGTYRADPEGTAHTSKLTTGEWPPSPARLFSALVAADGTGARCRHTDGSELLWLESLDPPRIEASGAREVVDSPINPRYVVKEERLSANTTQEYVGRVAAQVRPGARVSPRDPVVRYVWTADPSLSLLGALQLRAARVGYLGCADSPVRLRFEAPEDWDESGPAYRPSRDGERPIAVVEAGMTERLDRHFQRWLEVGPNLRRSQSPGLRRLAWYRPPEQSTDDDQSRPPVVWLVLDEAISGRRVLALTEALRGAILANFDRVVGAPPPVLHGHGFSGKGYDTARYLALPDVGGRHSDGRIHGLAVWLPAGTEPWVVDGCRAALGGQRQLRGPGVNVAVRPWAGAQRPWSAHPDRWLNQPSRFWTSAFPVVHERSRRRVDLDEVNRWCAHAGLPAAVSFRTARGPLVAGGADLAPSEVNRPDRPARRYGHLELELATEVTGPIAVGSGRQFGLGLLVPRGPADG